MGSSFHSLYYHLVFHTKNSNPFIAPEWRHRLHTFLGGCVRHHGAVCLAVGGVADHVHLLVRLKPIHSIAELMRDIKSASSRWVHTEIKLKEFGWQDGYGAFSVSRSGVGAVKRYVLNQEHHHRRISFREEYIRFLQQSGIDYDERYLL